MYVCKYVYITYVCMYMYNVCVCMYLCVIIIGKNLRGRLAPLNPTLIMVTLTSLI